MAAYVVDTGQSYINYKCLAVARIDVIRKQLGAQITPGSTNVVVVQVIDMPSA